MLSRLSDIAKGVNTVLHELSGEGDEEPESTPEAEAVLEAEVPEDVLERLAHTEQLVGQLKELIREKDLQFQKNEAAHKGEKELAEARLAKLKMQAKGRIAALTNRIEELQSGVAHFTPSPTPSLTISPTPPLPESPAQTGVERVDVGEQTELDRLRQELLAEAQGCWSLQGRLESTEEQLRDCKQQLEQRAAEHTAQIQGLQQVIVEKDGRFQEQIHKHEEELVNLTTQGSLQLQQTIRSLQTKLEEKEEALVGRMQVLEMLQQELNSSEQDKQALAGRLQAAEEALARAEEAERDSAQAPDGENHSQAQPQEANPSQEGLDSEGASQAEMLLLQETRGHVRELEEQVRSLKSAAEEQEVALLNRVAEMEEEKGSLLLKVVEFEEVRAENESLHGRVRELEEQSKRDPESENPDPNQAGVTVTMTLEPITEGHVAQTSTGETEDGTDVGGAEGEASEHGDMQGVRAEAWSGEQLSDACNLMSAQSSSCEKDQELRDVLHRLAEAQELILRLRLELKERTGGVTASAVQEMERGFISLLDPSGEQMGMREVALLSPAGAMERGSVWAGGEEEGSTTTVQQEATPCSSPEDMGSEPGPGSGEQAEARGDSGEEQRGELCGNRPAEKEENLQGQEPEDTKALPEQLQQAEVGHDEEELGHGEGELQHGEPEAGLTQLTVDSLTEERDGLLVQVELRDKELSEVMRLNAELERGQESVALTGQALRLEMEEAIVKNHLLEERLQSSDTESRAKDVKIKALQKDMDVLQRCMSEQEARAREAREQGRESEHAMAWLSQALREREVQAEELQRRLDNTEQQLALAQQDLAQEATEAKWFRAVLAQREEEVSEVTTSLSEKMVQLNEDKFSLGEEVKRLRERLHQLEASRGEVGPQGDDGLQTGLSERQVSQTEAGEGWAESTGDLFQPSPDKGQVDDTGINQAAEEKAGLEEELEKLKKENEQIKRKLQASLVKRKELLKKVKALEKIEGLETSQSPGPGHADSDTNIGSSRQERDPELTAHLDAQIVELRRELSHREAEFRDVSAVLREQEAAMGQLRELVEDLNGSMAERETMVSCLQTTISEKDLTIQQLLAQSQGLLPPETRPANQAEGEDSEGKEVEIGYPRMEVLEPVTSLGGVSGSDQEAKIGGSELDREQLEEALTSLKEMIKKAQEKDRHHQEQVRQHKEEYSLLMENLSQEQREKDSLHLDLLSLRDQLYQAEELPSASSQHQDLMAILRQKDEELEQLQLRLKQKEEVHKDQGQEKAEEGLIREHGPETLPGDKPEASAEMTEASAEMTEASAEMTEASAEMTEASAEATEASAEATEASAEATEASAEATEASAEATEASAEATEASAEATEAIAEATEASAEVTEASAEATEARAEATEARAEVTEAREEQKTPLESADSHWSQEWVDISAVEMVQVAMDGPGTGERFGSRSSSDVVGVEAGGREGKPQESVDLNQKAREESEERILGLQHTFELEREELLEEIGALKAKCQEAEVYTEHLKLALETAKSQTSLTEELAAISKEYKELKAIWGQSEEETKRLHLQLKEQEELVEDQRRRITSEEELAKALQDRMGEQLKEREELRAKLQEARQREEDSTQEAKSRQQIQRKLQAALISRKEMLKENKSLKEELADRERDKQELAGKMADLERTCTTLRRESEETALKMSGIREQNEKLIEEVDKALDENYNLNSSCESLKLAVEGLSREKDSMEQEMVSLREIQTGQSSEWESKRAELQQEYETLLQAYENVGGETARLGRALDMSKQDRQELLSRLRAGEAGTRELEAQLEETAQEQERTREKMRKFAKSKQVKIQELEEEIMALQVERHPGMTAATQTVPGTADEVDSRGEGVTGGLDARNQQLMAERVSLEEEAMTLRMRLAEAEQELKESVRKAGESEGAWEQDVTSQDVTAKEEVPPVGHPEAEVKLEFEGKLESGWISPAGSTLAPEADRSGRRASELEKRVNELENQCQDTKNEIQALMEARQAWEEERAQMEGEVVRQREELKRVEQSLSEQAPDATRWHEKMVAATREKETAEAERDDLEEKLMNQLAELNCSIANYQQELEDSVKRVSELEMAAQGQGRQVGELHEEVRQLRRSKADGEDRMRKEFEQKVKAAQRGRDGSKTHNAELQELLREKQQEVKQLQKDCILYQESISHLQKSIKALQFVQDETHKALNAAKKEAADRAEDSRRAREELAVFRIRLDDTQSEAGRVLADNARLREDVKATEGKTQEQLARMEKELDRKLELEQNKCRKEVRNAQERAEGLEREKAHTETTVRELRDILEEKREEAKRLQTSFNENLAKLAAFTRSMSSLQDDRDRIIDESRKWEAKFNQDMVRKEEEMRSGQEEVARLKEAFRQSTIQAEELELKLSRSELAEREWESRLESVEANRRVVVERLEEEASKQVARLEELQKLCTDSENKVCRLSEEVRGLQEEAATLRSQAETLIETQVQLEARLRDSEAESQSLRLTREQLSSDLQTSKALTDQLQAEAGETEGKIVALLEAKEAAVGSATSDLQQQHAGELGQWEARLREAKQERGQAERDLRELQSVAETLRGELTLSSEETQRHKDKMLTFGKSMASLQADRERVLAELRELEVQHRELGELRERQAGEGAQETAKLQLQLRELQAHMDDINSENAKLSAQLIRYREDLNQVITMKDCQHKQVLSSQMERVRALEEENVEVSERLGEAESREQHLTQRLEAVTEEKESLRGQLASLEGKVLELRQEVESLSEGGPLRVLEDKLEGKSEEAEKLRGALARAVTERDEAGGRLRAADARHTEELDRRERETGIMRNETETAEERVAELARDLQETEERLRKVMEEREGLRAQNQSFGKAMGSLQHSRDELLAELEERSSEEAEARCRALEEDKAGLTAQLDGFARTVMALQGERDRLSDQLARGQRVQESRQGASPGPGNVHSPTEAEAQSLRKALAALQDDRDRLLKELGELRAERVQAGEEAKLRGQLGKLEEQLEEQRASQEQAHQDIAGHLRQLQQLRDEKQELEQQTERYLVTVSDKERELSELQAYSHKQQMEVQRLETERSGLTSQLNACLTELHHRELRIQHLNSKMAQVYEERNTLSAQARRNAQHQRDTQQQLSQLQAQLHTVPKSDSSVDTAPGGPQEIRGPESESKQTESGDLKLRLAEARRLQERAEGEVERLRLSLAEEQEKRLGTEEALLASQQQLRSAELSEWVSAQEEHALLIELPHSTASTRTNSRISGTRCLRSLCFPRSRNKMLLSIYMMVLHTAVLLCVTGVL